MKDLLEEAARLSVRVDLARLPDEVLGYYVHGERRIYIDLRLTVSERRETLAHELGHAYCGHECTDGNEEAADRRAALLLVDPDEYAEAERAHHHPRAIAEALGLSEHIVTVWREWWLPQIIRRLSNAQTTARPRDMGAHQAR